MRERERERERERVLLIFKLLLKEGCEVMLD